MKDHRDSKTADIWPELLHESMIHYARMVGSPSHRRAVNIHSETQPVRVCPERSEDSRGLAVENTRPNNPPTCNTGGIQIDGGDMS